MPGTRVSKSATKITTQGEGGVPPEGIVASVTLAEQVMSHRGSSEFVEARGMTRLLDKIVAVPRKVRIGFSLVVFG